jgi:hypothetical protein
MRRVNTTIAIKTSCRAKTTAKEFKKSKAGSRDNSTGKEVDTVGSRKIKASLASSIQYGRHTNNSHTVYTFRSHQSTSKSVHEDNKVKYRIRMIDRIRG